MYPQERGKLNSNGACVERVGADNEDRTPYPNQKLRSWTYVYLDQTLEQHRMQRTEEQKADLEKRIEDIGSWYHAIDLGDGIRTPGAFDMAPFLGEYDFPESMEGMRVLDVGASNGFFSFEFHRRGAAEVVAIDLPTWGAHDWTPRYRASYEAKAAEERDKIDRATMRAGFELCREALGCDRVTKKEMAIYDMSPETLGEFDLVFCGSMLMHVRDPVLGVQSMRSVCKDDGKLIITASCSFEDSAEPIARFAGEWDQCNWWQMNPACLDRILLCSDFEVVDPRRNFVVTDTTGDFRDPHYLCHARPLTV